MFSPEAEACTSGLNPGRLMCLMTSPDKYQLDFVEPISPTRMDFKDFAFYMTGER
jgi:hypothetical protein